MGFLFAKFYLGRINMFFTSICESHVMRCELKYHKVQTLFT